MERLYVLSRDGQPIAVDLERELYELAGHLAELRKQQLARPRDLAAYGEALVAVGWSADDVIQACKRVGVL